MLLAFATAEHPAVRRAAPAFLERLEPVFPGASGLWNGRASQSLAHRDPNLGLSYSNWRVGQYQRLAGYERVPQGNVFLRASTVRRTTRDIWKGRRRRGRGRLGRF